LNYWQVHDTLEVENTIGVLPQESGGSSSRFSSHGLTCLSWNDCPFELAKLAVGGYSKHAVVWSCDRKTGRWVEEVDLGDHGGVVHDIAWAPVMGRSYHQIATACRDKTVRVFMLLRRPDQDGSLEKIESTEEQPNPAILTCTSPVWRVAWNATGTILATSGDDGTLSLWRKDFSGVWKVVQNMGDSSTVLRSQYKYH
jgi:nucleoporin SEH1